MAQARARTSETCCQFRTRSQSEIGRSARHVIHPSRLRICAVGRTIVWLARRSGWRHLSKAPIPDIVSHRESGIRWGLYVVVDALAKMGLAAHDLLVIATADPDPHVRDRAKAALNAQPSQSAMAQTR